MVWTCFKPTLTRLDVFQANFDSFGRVSSLLWIVWTRFKTTLDRLNVFQDNFGSFERVSSHTLMSTRVI
jgi:hypothetical protein